MFRSARKGKGQESDVFFYGWIGTRDRKRLNPCQCSAIRPSHGLMVAELSEGLLRVFCLLRVVRSLGLVGF